MLEKLMRKYADLQKKEKKGFTLIELVIVIVIIAILALIMVPNITRYINKSEESKIQANLRSMYTNVQLVAAENDIEPEEVFDKAEAELQEYANVKAEEFGKYSADSGDGTVTLKYKGKGDKVYTFDGTDFGGDFESTTDAGE